MDQIHCGYRSRDVIRGFSARCSGKEIVGILGPNGSGKTTLLLAVSGLITPRSGTICVAGRNVATQSPRWLAAHIATVPQRIEFSFGFRCLSVVLMGRYPHLDHWGGYSEHDRTVALQAMEELGIVHLAHRPIQEVSGGEAQLVIIARALAQQTPIILMDEATASLDAARRIQVFDLIAAKNGQGATVVCVMHDLNLAALYCHRLIFLKEGKTYAEGRTEDVFADDILSEVYETEIKITRHPVTAAPQAHFVPGFGHGRGVPALACSGLRGRPD